MAAAAATAAALLELLGSSRPKLFLLPLLIAMGLYMLIWARGRMVLQHRWCKRRLPQRHHHHQQQQARLVNQQELRQQQQQLLLQVMLQAAVAAAAAAAVRRTGHVLAVASCSPSCASVLAALLLECTLATAARRARKLHGPGTRRSAKAGASSEACHKAAGCALALLLEVPF